MGKRISFRWHKSIIPAIILLIFFIGIVDGYSISRTNAVRPDIIMIDLPPIPGADQMPAVQFLHDKHTEALDDKKDCSRCHIQDKDRFVFKFKRIENTTTEKDMTIYHDNCISCHVEKIKAGSAAGPVAGDCRSCHNTKSKISSSWKAVRFDKSLHYRHESAQSIKPLKVKDDVNCNACHHKYDAVAQKTVYVKGEEENCRYCHKSLKTEAANSIRSASHAQCVNCHQTLTGKSVKTGPVDCKACHDAREQKKIETVQNVPRLKRNQPDKTLIASWIMQPELSKETVEKQMRPVAFNHRRHEEKADSCITCHHASLKQCSICHTETGHKDGGFVRLEQAMHEPRSDQSCIGCHQTAQKDKNCSGCHSLMPKKNFEDEKCKRCHALDKSLLYPLPMSQKDKAGLAADVLAAKNASIMKVPDNLIPEKIKIGIIAKEYEPAIFPHRQIVRGLESRIAENKMADYFHDEATTLCMGCHHNSPATFTPSKCATCHGEAFKSGQNGRPGLKGAYHGQCIDCHQKMEIKEPAATDCIKCHKEKKQ